jgi:hypothetical protein
VVHPASLVFAISNPSIPEIIMKQKPKEKETIDMNNPCIDDYQGLALRIAGASPSDLHPSV